jgi:DNA-directed RNA polymerase subunit F
LSENVKNADDFNNIDYANLFTEIENPDIQALVSELITIPYNENETDENGDLTRQAQIRQDLFEYVEQEKQNFLNRNNIFRDGGSDLDRAKQLLDSAISKLDTSPEEAAEDFQKLKEFLESPTVSEDVKEDILKIFKAVENLNVADKIQKIVDIARTQAKSPVIELAKIISFDLTGEENSFLDLIESQKGVLSKKTRASEFILPQNIRRDLEVTEKVMPIVQSVL